MTTINKYSYKQENQDAFGAWFNSISDQLKHSLFLRLQHDDYSVWANDVLAAGNQDPKWGDALTDSLYLWGETASKKTAPQKTKKVFKVIDTSRDQMALYNHLCKQAMRLTGEATQRRVMSILDNAADNAAQTIYNEKAAPVTDWNRIFVGSIELLLSSGGENTTAVINWFHNRNISA